MLLATTTDFILAGIKNIQQALHQAPSGINVPPSHVAALKRLIDVFTGSTICKDEDPAPNPQQSLRVERRQTPVSASKDSNYPPLRL
jgi:hypothetical protein